MIALIVGGFEDNDGSSKKESSEASDQIDMESLKKAEVGDVVEFGSYEQDNDASNGKEEIEWLILAIQDNKVLLISKDALDCQPYNAENTDSTWETCPLRKWLNNEFYNAAFSGGEKAQIATTIVVNQENGTDGGNDTNDKVFLLSISEANEYFNSYEARMCAPTDYAIAQGLWTSDNYTTGGKAACCWWLRFPGNSFDNTTGVNYSGEILCYSNVNYLSLDGVRPAMWINLDS